MKITGTGSLQPSDSIRRKGTVGRSSATSFAGELTDETPVQGASGLGDVGGVSSLLTIQEIGDPIAERKRAVRRGQDMLDRLDELRHGLLMGSFPAEKLDSLLATVQRQHDRVADPRLREVLREIELRAAVELAKLGRME
jgi:hypothetical protein